MPILAALSTLMGSRHLQMWVPSSKGLEAPSSVGSKHLQKPSVFQFFSVFEQQTVLELVLVQDKPFRSPFIITAADLEHPS
jgi:hypothetical protein